MISIAQIPVAIIVRVSTPKQEASRQISELQAIATKKGWLVVETIEEIVSGKAKDRPGLDRALALAQSGTVKKVLVHEVSRLARSNSKAHEFVEKLTESGVSLYWHSQGVETLLDNGKKNPATFLMFSMLSEIATSEREAISERIKSGLNEAKRKGVKLGRREGSGFDKDEVLERHSDVVKLLKEGLSIRHISMITKKAPMTIQKVKKVASIIKFQPVKIYEH